MLLSEVAFLPTELITATAVVENAQSGSPYSAVLNSLPPLLKPQAKYSSVYKVESKHPNAIIQPGKRCSKGSTKARLEFCNSARPQALQISAGC